MLVDYIGKLSDNDDDDDYNLDQLDNGYDMDDFVEAYNPNVKVSLSAHIWKGCLTIRKLKIF